MARNRKLQSAGVRFGPALKAFLLCLLIGGSGVGYVWQKEQIIRLDRQIKAGEVHLKELENKNDGSRKQLTAMRSPPALQPRIKALGLVEPQPAQKWRLAEPTADAPTPAPVPVRQAQPVGQIVQASRTSR